MRYIEIVAEFVTWRQELADWQLCSIGEFTREHVARCLESQFEVGVYGWKDFHAVCDDIDIPWATKEGFDCYRRVSLQNRLQNH
jgi:hypothetical protein